MTRRLLYLSGLAILAVVTYHAVGWGYVGMFWWTDRYAAVAAVPDFGQMGSSSYYGMRLIEQTVIPGVPAFLFVSGVFAAFASGMTPKVGRWQWIPRRIMSLLIPYVIWSFVAFVLDYALGERASGIALLRLLVLGGTSPGFYFVPLLCQLYVLSPILVPLAKRSWLGLLFGTALVQIAVEATRYADYLRLAVPQGVAVLTPSWFFPGNVFWFAFGLVLGIHSAQLLGGIARLRWVWLAGTLLLLIPAMVEWELLLRASGEAWLDSTATLLDSIHILLFLLTFLGFGAVRLPGLSQVSSLGSKSYGIYLVHGLALTLAAKTVYNLTPGILAMPLAFTLMLAICGVGLPLLIMGIVRRSPVARIYPYLFG